MIPVLARFVEALRKEGVSASPSEVLDAARAVLAVGIEHRARFRSALRATLAKEHRVQEVFDRAFDRFFTHRSPSAGREGERPGVAGLGGTGSTGGSGRPARRKPRPDSVPSRPGTGERARSDPRQRHEVDVDRVRRAIAATRAGGPKREGRLRTVKSPRPAGKAPGARAAAQAPGPLRQDLTRPMPTDEERRLARMLPRILDELRLRRGRRLARSRRGRLWVRRLYRQGQSNDGVPFVLPFRRPRPRRPKVVLLVDVSFSVARAAGYFLWMASEFLRPGRRARVIAFVDRPVDATAPVARWLTGKRAGDPGSGAGNRTSRRGRRPGAGIEPAGFSFAGLLDGLPGLNLEAPSDYGRAFYVLLHSHLRPAGRDTILVVLGDARTNRFDPLAWALDEISRRCSAVIWLVPEPESRWGTGDSVLAAYLPFVDTVVEATNLAGLARGVSELLKRL